MLGTYKAHILLSNQGIGLCKNLRKSRKRAKEDSGNGTRLETLYIETYEYLSRMLGVPQLWSICRQYFSRDQEHQKEIGCSECVSACTCPHWYANNKLLGKEIQWVLEFGPEIHREAEQSSVIITEQHHWFGLSAKERASSKMAGGYEEKERKPRPDTLLKVLGHKKGLEKLGMEQTGRQEGTEDADRLNSL